MASVFYNLNGNDETLILDTRARLLQPFVALNWFDLRLSMMVSITKLTDPNDPTGLAQSGFGAGGDTDQVYIGFKSSDTLFPPSSNFFGMSTRVMTFPAATISMTDSGSGYYLFDSDGDGNLHFLASNGVTKSNNPLFITSTRLQDSLAGTYTGYATLLMFRLVRSDPSSLQIDSLQASQSGNFFDNGVPFATDTSVAAIRAATAGATWTQEIGPFTFATVPNAIYAYWPFSNSRLRIHDYVLEKYA